jgi:hypothetical protein
MDINPLSPSFPPSSFPLIALPTPLKAIARGFLVLFHKGI